MDKMTIDRWILYAQGAAAVVLTLYFGYQGVQRIVVDHVRAVQQVARLSKQVTTLREALQKARVDLQIQKRVVKK